MRIVSPILKRVVYPSLSAAGVFRRTTYSGFAVVTYHGVLPPGSQRPFPVSTVHSAVGTHTHMARFLQYANDEATLAYLLRSAARLRVGNAEAFGLVDQQGLFVHFAWVAAFDGFFLSELQAKVDAPSPDCVVLFDCWTPPAAARSHGYYSRAVALVAERMQKNGKKPWILSAGGNAASLRGLAKSGFQRRYFLVRKRVMRWQKVKSSPPAAREISAAEVSAHV